MNPAPSIPESAMTPPEAERQSFRRYLATSPKPFPTFVRAVYKGVTRFSVPAPGFIVRPMLWIFLTLQSCWLFFQRVFIAEPLWKATCKSYGKNFNTGTFTPWINGKGDIIVGDDVIIGGKMVIGFGARYAERPVLKIGNNVVIGHDTMFVVGRQVTIGDNCRISGQCWIADSNGHATEFDSSIGKHKPPAADEVRPVIFGDNVWLGRLCLVFPGVKIGTGSVISAGSVVRGHIPAYCVAAGNPAKVLFRLKRPTASPAAASQPSSSAATTPSPAQPAAASAPAEPTGTSN